MAAPSSLPSAAVVAQLCYDRWAAIDKSLDLAMRNDLAALATHFYVQGNFKTEFLKIVPWHELLGVPNSGHAAVSDFLITRAAYGTLSANFDPLIENWARERKMDLRGALDGREAAAFSVRSSPLVKFHGCMDRDRENTIWTERQFSEALIQDRVTTCTQWINLHLPGKHVIVVGFWSDWGYLNNAIAGALNSASASAVTVVDPAPSADLQVKAPELWRNLRGLSGSFQHVPMSGAEFLDELRREFSKVWARRFYALGAPLAMATGVTLLDPPDSDVMSVEDLYDLRRDGEGVPYLRACTLKQPAANAAQTALARIALRAAGATNDGAWLRYRSSLIRVINGAGQGVESMKGHYKEPTSLRVPDIVLCAGAIRLGVPARIIPAGRGTSIVRGSAGSYAKWMSFEETKAEIGL